MIPLNKPIVRAHLHISSAKVRFLFLFFIILMPFWTHAQDGFGEVTFKPTGAGVADNFFIKGLNLMYCLEYEDAIKEFEMAQLMDPTLVMAYWGEAMCYNKVYWHNRDVKAGQGALFKLAVRRDARAKLIQTDLEKGLFEAAEVLYNKDLTSNEQRDTAMVHYMEKLYQQHKRNVEVIVLYAQAIYGSCSEGCDEKVYAKISELADIALAIEPNHVGALMAKIMANDRPQTAFKALSAADNISKAAPASRFARHMSSHIFLHQGQWDAFLSANAAAWKISEQRVVQKKIQLTDRDYHIAWWLQYGYLQKGMYKKAFDLLFNMNQDARYGKTAFMRYHLVAMKGTYMAETNKWLGDAARMDIPTMELDTRSKAVTLYLDARSTLEEGDPGKLDWYAMQIADQTSVDLNNRPLEATFVLCGHEAHYSKLLNEVDLAYTKLLELQLRAIKAYTDKDYEQMSKLLLEAAGIEEKTKSPSSPPLVVKPSRELLGEYYLNINEPAKALEQFSQCLQLYPNRSLALAGKYKAMVQSGDAAQANQFKTLLTKNLTGADEGVLNQLIK